VAEGGVARAVEGVGNKKKASIFLVEFWSNRQSGGDGGQVDNTLPENHLRVTIAQPHHMNMDPTTKNKRKKTKNNGREMRTRYIYPCLIQKPTPLKQTDQVENARRTQSYTRKKTRHMNTCVSKRGTQKINQKL
jgi:hypothetical protein